MKSKLKAGVIGVGHLGRFHLEKLLKIEDVELVGFYDIDREKADRIAGENSVRSAESLEELIDACDVVSVVVPTVDHYDVASKALESGCHVFCEKPLTETAEQGERLVDQANRAGLKLGVGHIERFNPAIRAMRGRIGKPMFIEAHRLNPFNPRGLDVAVILELMIHDIDLCLYFTRSEVSEIHASAVQVLSDKMDIANVRLKFESGCVANLTASRISPTGMRKIRIFQRDNYLSFDLHKKKVDNFLLVDDQFETGRLEGFSTSFEYGQTGKKIVYNQPAGDDYDMLEEELCQFLRAVEAGDDPPVSGRDGFRALKIALEVQRQAAEQLAKVGG
ncbi:MAG: gfo/Idh/MocA family oxidoreductase [candidate division Zixibacteria bacterium]|nr:gfo/Idh/MocA family oxidoreductase [candidate division Zixibacteria bacterium]